jgi:hypothetical protein
VVSTCWHRPQHILKIALCRRGVGTIPQNCPPGYEKNGLLCYPVCRGGFNGVGPVCWQSDCPAGYTDLGALCHRFLGVRSSDNRRCPWYDKCGLFGARGCSVCPSGWKNDGCTCRVGGMSISQNQKMVNGYAEYINAMFVCWSVAPNWLISQKSRALVNLSCCCALRNGNDMFHP